MPPIWNGGGGGDPAHPGTGGGSSGTPCEDARNREWYNEADVIDYWAWIRNRGEGASEFYEMSEEEQCEVIIYFYDRWPSGNWRSHGHGFDPPPPEDTGGDGGLVNPPTGANEIETIYEGRFSGVYVGLWAKETILAVQVRTPALGIVPATNNRTLWEFPDLNTMVDAVSDVGDKLKSLGFG